jgi:hypothetical protein
MFLWCLREDNARLACGCAAMLLHAGNSSRFAMTVFQGRSW